MNKLGVLVGIAATIVITGGFVAYASYESSVEIPSKAEARNTLTEFTEELENTDPGYGQLEKQEGAYSP